MISLAENNIMAHLRLEQKTNCAEVRHGTKRTCKSAICNIYLGLVLLLILTPKYLVASHDPWGENLQPKLHTDYLNEHSGM
jgi:hypothetical protein